MFESNQETNEQLDRAGQLILRTAAADEAETEAAAASPFLYTRVRARIAEEQQRSEEAGWLSILFVARRAVPAMALVALLAAVLMLWSALSVPVTPNNFDEDALLGAPGAGVEQTVLADRNGLSRDEILNIVVDRNYERGAR